MEKLDLSKSIKVEKVYINGLLQTPRDYKLKGTSLYLEGEVGRDDIKVEMSVSTYRKKR